MTVPILLLAVCELDLAITAGALGIGLRRAHPLVTVLATLGISLAVSVALLALWALWFVAPACVAAGSCALPAAAPAWFAGLAGAQWTGLAAVALLARQQAARANSRRHWKSTAG